MSRKLAFCSLFLPKFLLNLSEWTTTILGIKFLFEPMNQSLMYFGYSIFSTVKFKECRNDQRAPRAPIGALWSGSALLKKNPQWTSLLCRKSCVSGNLGWNNQVFQNFTIYQKTDRNMLLMCILYLYIIMHEIYACLDENERYTTE